MSALINEMLVLNEIAWFSMYLIVLQATLVIDL